MKQTVARLAVAVALVVAGWTLGRAQIAEPPDFVIDIEAPIGVAAIICSRGCLLQGDHDRGNPNNTGSPRYEFGCRGVDRGKATVNGWLKR